MPPDFVSSSFINSYPCFEPLSSIDNKANLISPGPKKRPQRPHGNPPPINGVAIPPRHQLPRLPYILELLKIEHHIIRFVYNYIVRYIFCQRIVRLPSLS